MNAEIVNSGQDTFRGMEKTGQEGWWFAGGALLGFILATEPGCYKAFGIIGAIGSIVYGIKSQNMELIALGLGVIPGMLLAGGISVIGADRKT